MSRHAGRESAEDVAERGDIGDVRIKDVKGMVCIRVAYRLRIPCVSLAV